MKRALHIAIGTLLAVSIQAQETSKTEVTYDLTAETAVGTGDFTAYQLVSNRHHVLSTRANTGYVRGALNVRHPLGNDFLLSGGVDAIASVHADHKAYLQRCFANLQWKGFYVEAGIREQKPVLRNSQLSVGHFSKGINAKPVPQLHIGTNDF